MYSHLFHIKTSITGNGWINPLTSLMGFPWILHYIRQIANQRTSQRIESNVEGWLVGYITQSTIGSQVMLDSVQDVIQTDKLLYNQLPPTHQDSFCVMLVKHLKPINLKTNQPSQQWGAVNVVLWSIPVGFRVSAVLVKVQPWTLQSYLVELVIVQEIDSF